jgi:hypothetical protein
MPPSLWNRTGYRIKAGQTFSLSDENGKPAGLMKLLTSWSNSPNFGVNTGNNAGIYPDQVTRYDFAYTGGGKSIIQFSGLDTSKVYDFTFFASWAHPWSPATMTYQIGNRQANLDATNDSTQTVTLMRNKPDSLGNILVYIRNADGDYNTTLIGALVLNAYTPTLNSLKAPSHVSAQNIGGNYYILRWDTVTAARKYLVYRSNQANGPFLLFDSVTTNSHANKQIAYYTSIPLSPDTGLFYRIQAVSSSLVLSPFSAIIHTYRYGPYSPLSISYGNQFLAGAFNIFYSLYFTPLAGDKLHFYRSLTGLPGTFIPVGVVDATLQGSPFPYGFNDTTIAPNTQYFYYGTFERSGTEYFPSQIIQSFPDPCGELRDLSGLATSGNSITLKWTTVVCADSYLIYRSTQKMGPYVAMANQGVQNYFIDTGLIANTRYYYYVSPHYYNEKFQAKLDTISVVTQSPDQTLVNFGNNDSFAPPPWNNTGYAIDQGLSFSLQDQNGKPSGTLNLLTSWSNTPTLGVNTQNNSGVYPDKVIRSAFALDGPGKSQVQFSGLDTLKVYDFTFFSSWSHPWSPGAMTYQIGNTTVILDATNNSAKTVSIKGAKPDTHGNIQVTIGNEAGGNNTTLVGAITYSGYTLPETNPLSPTNLAGSVLLYHYTPSDTVQLSWDRVPGISKYYIYKRDAAYDLVRYDSVSMGGNSGNRVYYLDKNTPFGGGNAYAVVSVNSNNLFSNFSNEVSVGIPAAPSSQILLTLDSIINGKATLRWTEINPQPGDTVDVYLLQHVGNPFLEEFFNKIKSIPVIFPLKNGNLFSLNVNGDLSYLQEFYYLQLRRSGKAYPPSDTVAYDIFNCSPIYNIIAKPLTLDSIILQWDNQGICSNGYYRVDNSTWTVYRSTQRNSGYVKVGQGNYLTYFKDTVSYNKNYYYYVVPGYPVPFVSTVRDTIEINISTPNTSLAVMKGAFGSAFSLDSIQSSHLVVYPVPVTGDLHYSFSSPHSGTYILSLYTSSGALVYLLKNQPLQPGLNGGIIQFGNQDIQSGVYILRVESDAFSPKVVTFNKL